MARKKWGRHPVDPFGVGVNSYSRLGVVMQNHDRMPRSAWFAQLGDAWSMCDNIATWRPVLRAILLTATRAELDQMMTPNERSAWLAMPPRFRVWRGCYQVNRPGISWTTDPCCAERIVTLNRYCRPGEQPLLRQGTTRRDRAVLKLDRNESEIVTAHVFGITETRIGGTPLAR